MNPFDQPPTSDPVSTEPPRVGLVTPATTGRRGRMALVALATAGMIGGGVAAVSQFASADEPALTAATPTTVADDEPMAEPTGQPSEEPSGGQDDDGVNHVDGQVVIDLGNGDDPVVIDLGELGQSFDDLAACLDLPLSHGPMSEGDVPHGPMVDGPVSDGDIGQMLDDFLQNLDLENLDLGDLQNLDLGQLGDFAVSTADGSHVMVFGPDGASMIELGDGDGSVTVSQTDGELSITTDGDATVQDLPDFSEMPPFGEFDMGQLLGDSFDPSQIQSCLDDLG